ncbi:hypothetical protein [Streptomyces sp. NPDC049879]|uniref:hypothetical protein n=1 Tax=Streptomyces sp. NPDC049879 TaxID=3365598 RepID=UPI0037B7C862
MADLSATYTVTYVGEERPTVITPKVRVRQRAEGRLTSIAGLAPLLAEHIDRITDYADRQHTLLLLRAARITIADYPRGPMHALCTVRDEGRLCAGYTGTRDLPADVVLDLAEELRDQLC